MATKTHPKENKAVHRNLHLSSPLMSGPDVKELQQDVKVGLAHYKIDWLPLALDGQLGKQTIHACDYLAWAIGLTGASSNGGLTITQDVQKKLRDPSKRTKAEHDREHERKTALQKRRKAQEDGPKAVVAYARSFVGTTENPAGSNSGPSHTEHGLEGGVTFWENYWHLGECFWCLCFASYTVQHIGGANISGTLVNAAEVERMAKAHTNGLIAVPVAEARPGDFALWCFDGSGTPDHGELIVKCDAHGPVEDIGGNTSSEGGSQSNGGGVFTKELGSSTRPWSSLTCVARPLYA